MNEQTRNEIIRQWHAGASMRSIARTLRISRHTVARALRRHQQHRAEGAAHPELPTPPQRRSSLLDAHMDSFRALLARYPHITAMRMLEELRADGFTGAYTIVRQRLRELRPQARREPVVRFETAPGVQAQMDYALYDLDFTQEGRRRVNLFSYVLGYSRRQYLRFVETQDFQATVQQHIYAFEHLGGAATICLYDNFKVVVIGYDGDDPIYNPRFLAFATHYGFKPRACRRRRPQTKGKVERPFDYVEKNLLNGRQFRSLEHLNEVTARWLANVADVRVHRTTRKRPVDAHAEEHAHLLPLPDHPYDTAVVVYRTVDAEGNVAYRQNAYSVPWKYIGRVLPLRITDNEVIVYGPEVDEVARHTLLPRTISGQCSEHRDHRPRHDHAQRLEILKERFVELGPAAVRFFDGLVQAQRYGKNQAHKVLALLATYRQDDLVEALQRAVRFGAFSLKAIERILGAQAQPKTPLESLADQHHEHLSELWGQPPVTPRPAAEYAQLFLQEAPEDGQSPEQQQE